MRVRSVRILSFLFGALSLCTIAAIAEEKFKIPSTKSHDPEFVKKAVANAKLLGSRRDVKTLSSRLRAKVLSTRFKDVVPRTRGSQDALLFRKAAPAVVLVLGSDGSKCSGSLLQDNVILTAAHCVEDDDGQVINQVIQGITGNMVMREGEVVFKPTDANGESKEEEIVKTVVIKVDHKRDLALLRLLAPAPYAIAPLVVASDDAIEVGADVHAIGHLHSLNWTYTKGVISQIRPGYVFGPKTDPKLATVIQASVAINGGNSGGPLLSDDGKIVGVVSFSKAKTESLHFAIAAKEVRLFLNDPASVLAICDEPKPVSKREHDDEEKAFVTRLSGRCDGEADILVVEPDDQTKPFYAEVYSRKNQKKYGEIIGDGRTGRWSESIWDENFDGTYSVAGLHPDGKLLPSKVGERCPRGTKAAPKLECKRI